MRLYTVLTAPNLVGEQATKLVDQGFSWNGFWLPILWLPMKRLWVAFALLLSFYIFAGLAPAFHLMTPEASLALPLVISLFVGLEGRNWERAGLVARGYVEVGMVAGADLLDAETRWFIAHPPHSLPSPMAAPFTHSILPWPGSPA